jgi:two-component system, NarL family, nitrate/nitrite response regulator NarL
MSACIRVGVIEQHPILRAGIVQTLTRSGECEVIAEGGSEAEAFRVAAQSEPDVILVGLHAELCPASLRRLVTEFPTVRLVLLTDVEEREQALGALRAGVAGYLLKRASGAELVQSIVMVHRGESYVFPSLAASLIKASLLREAEPPSPWMLTSRQEQIWECLTRGLSNKEIARHLDLAEKTVKHYLSELFAKLKVRNRVEAALLGQEGPRRVRELAE